MWRLARSRVVEGSHPDRRQAVAQVVLQREQILGNLAHAVGRERTQGGVLIEPASAAGRPAVFIPGAHHQHPRHRIQPDQCPEQVRFQGGVGGNRPAWTIPGCRRAAQRRQVEHPLRPHLVHKGVDRVLVEQVDPVSDNLGGQLGAWIHLGGTDRPVDRIPPPDEKVTEVAPGEAVDAGNQTSLAFRRPATPPPVTVARRLPRRAGPLCRSAPRAGRDLNGRSARRRPSA